MLWLNHALVILSATRGHWKLGPLALLGIATGGKVGSFPLDPALLPGPTATIATVAALMLKIGSSPPGALWSASSPGSQMHLKPLL